MVVCDAFVLIVGFDERVEFLAPVLDHYKTYNVAPVDRLLGIGRAVI